MFSQHDNITASHSLGWVRLVLSYWQSENKHCQRRQVKISVFLSGVWCLWRKWCNSLKQWEYSEYSVCWQKRSALNLHFPGCVWGLMRLLPCFLGPPGPRSWQADNVLILGCPGGNALGLPEDAHLLRLPAGRWKPLAHPLCVACLGQKNVLSQGEGWGWGWGVYTIDKWKIICTHQNI